MNLSRNTISILFLYVQPYRILEVNFMIIIIIIIIMVAAAMMMTAPTTTMTMLGMIILFHFSDDPVEVLVIDTNITCMNI